MTDTPAALPRVLLVDDSRIVRATIIKRIRDRFDVREEGDGEAAWEALLVDPEIHVVISDLSMPRLDGYGLIERIRSSKVPRIRNIPVIMISGDEDENARQRAKDAGATDFITKGTGTAELLARLESLVNLVRTQENLDEARAQAITDPPSGLLTPVVIERQAEQAFSFSRRHGMPANVLVIGFDRLEDVAAQHGGEVVDALLAQFAKLLAGAVRKEDSLARWSGSELAVITPGVSAEQARTFSERIRDAVVRANISLRGQQIRMSVTIGIAHLPVDEVADAPAWLHLARERMLRGQSAGGNRVVAREEKAPPPARVDEVLARIATGDKSFKRSQLARFGLWLLPLLRLIDKEFHLGLPLVDMERRLAAPQDD